MNNVGMQKKWNGQGCKIYWISCMLLSFSGIAFATDTAFRPEKHTPKYKDENAAEVEEGKALITGGVHFVQPKDGAKVKKTFKVVFGIKGMKVHPAGELIYGTGHHHLIIDGKPMPKMQPIPADDKHIHYGKGQTSDTITLKPGKHTLTMQFADGAHRSYGEEWSQTITVYVQE